MKGSWHLWRTPQMIRAERSLFHALYITAGVFLTLFVLSRIASTLYISSLATTASHAFEIGVKKELNTLKGQGDIVAQNELLAKYILERDIEKLLPLIQSERTAHAIGLMGVADANGIILSRTKSFKKTGENAFLTSPHGRVVGQGKSVESIETPQINPTQILFTTGRPIMHDGRMIGGLFANYLADDDFATQFKNAYLPGGTEVVFYTKNFGVYGNSFSSPEIHQLVHSYFNSGSEWVQNGQSEKTVAFKDGNYYLVKNIIFPGLEESPGGALIFIPRIDLSYTTNFITALLTALIFLFLALRQHLHSHGEPRGLSYCILLVLATLPIFGLIFFILFAQNTGFLELKRIPYALYNSTIRLQPDSGIFDMNFEQRFSIIIDTGDEAINAVSIALKFDPTMLDIKAFDTDNSACSYIIEKTIDIKTGEALLSCVILHSGEDRQSIPVGDIVALPKQRGTIALDFDNTKTQVLANDGLATNVLRMTYGGNYITEDFKTLSNPTASTTPDINKSFILFSPTHPNQNRWYKAPKARFVWHTEPETVYAYTLDNLPNTIPSSAKTTQNSAVDVSIPGDGIFFFHLRNVSEDTTSHYRIQADMTPPSITSIRADSEKIFIGDVVRFAFDAKDTTSGIQRNYYIDLGNHLFLPIGSNLFVPFLEPGDQKVILRVYDDAGNYTEKSQIIRVETP